MKQFIGDCRTILKRSDIFDDATEMAQAVENSKHISAQQFVDLTGSRGVSGCRYGSYRGLVWKYNPKNDVHYFYA